MFNPLVSVIIPNFNNQDYVGEAIKSTLNQTYKNVEIIVIDDGSTDASWSVIKSFPSVKAIRQTNQGACVARNTGLKIASGEYIKFLDSDDCLIEDCISMQVLQASNVSANAKIIPYGDSYTFFEDSNRKPIKKGKLGSAEFADWFDLLFGNILTSRPLYPALALRAVGGFDNQLMSKQEWCLNLKLHKHDFRFKYFPGETYWQRVHASEFRISNRVRKCEAEMTDLQFIQEKTQGTSGISMENFHSAWGWVFWVHGRAFLRAGNKEAASQFFDHAKSLSPYGYRRYWPLLYKLGFFVFGPSFAEKIWAKKGPLMLLLRRR